MTQRSMLAGDQGPSWLPLYRTQREPNEERANARRVDARAESLPVETDPVADPRLMVLVAEDEASIGWLVVTILETAGFRVTLAPDGYAALALVTRERPALVLTDRMMPDLGGIELVRCLRADPATRGLPVAMMSATRADVTRNPAEGGKTDTMATAQYIEIDGELVPFLSKPFELDDLVRLVRALAHETDERRSAQPASTH